MEKINNKSTEILNEEQEQKKCIENLRWFKGNNDAVQELSRSSNTETTTPLKNFKQVNRDGLLGSILNNYSGEAYGDYHWRKTSGGWTTPKIPTIYGKFRNDYKQYSQLSLDAGFITHLPEFMEEIKSSIPKDLEWPNVRERFKEILGEKIVWRGMMLAEDELDNIRNYGIESPFAKYLESVENPKSEFEAKMLSTDINELVEKHFHGENPLSPFISVSSYKDLAIAVGRYFGKKSDKKNFYLLKIKIPEIDRIYYTEHGIRKPDKLRDLQSKLSISVDDEMKEYEWDKDAESYLFWKINPDEIIEITQPDIKESSWNNKKTTGKL
jgi:hypothetical protein